MSPEVDDGEQHARFVALLCQSYRSLYSFAISLGADVHQADDLMQEVSILLWEHFEEFDLQTSFVRWGRTFVRNAFRNHCRSFWKKRFVFSPDVIKQLAQTQYEAEELLELRLSLLRRCLRLLPRADRNLVKSYYGQRTTASGIARKAGRTPAAIRKALSRIRMKLSACIDRQMGIGHD